MRSGGLRFHDVKTELRGSLLEQLHLLRPVSLLVVLQALVDVRVPPHFSMR
jgi:hypothetical protein